MADRQIEIYISARLKKAEIDISKINEDIRDIENKLDPIRLKIQLLSTGLAEQIEKLERANTKKFGLGIELRDEGLKEQIDKISQSLKNLQVGIKVTGGTSGGKDITEVLPSAENGNKAVGTSAKQAAKDQAQLNKQLEQTLMHIGDIERMVKTIEKYNAQGSLLARIVQSRDETGAFGKSVVMSGAGDIMGVTLTKNWETLRRERERVARLGEKVYEDISLKGITSYEEKINQLLPKLRELYGEHIEIQRIGPPTFTKNGDAVHKLVAVLKTGKDTFKQFSLIVDDATRSLYLQETQVKKNINRNLDLIEQFKIAASRVVLWAGATSLFYAPLRSFQRSIGDLIEFDAAITDLRKVTDETIETYREFAREANNIGNTLSRTAVEVVRATSEFAKLGYNLQQAKVLAQEALLFSNIGDMDVEQASTALISAIKGFGVEVDREGKNIRRIVDIYNEIGNNYAISSAGVAEALRRSAATLAEAGNTIEQSVAMIVAANNTIQDPAVVGTALKTVSMRLRGVTEDGESLGKEFIPTLEKSFNKLGLTLKRDENTFKSTFEIMRDLASVWNEISDIERARILEQVAGKRQGNIVAGMLANWEDAERAVVSALNAQGSAAAENEKAMQSLEAMVRRLTNSVQEFWRTFTDDALVRTVISLLTNLADAARIVVENLGSLTTVVLGLSTALFVLHRETLLAVATEFNKLIFGATNLRTVFQGINLEAIKTSVSLQGIRTAMLTTKTATDGATASVGLFSAALRVIPLVAVATLIAALINKIWTLRQEAKRMAEEQRQNAEAYAKNREEIQELYNEYIKLSNIPKDDLTIDEYERLVEVQNELGKLLPGVVQGFDRQGNVILIAANKTKEYIAQMEKLNEELERQRDLELREAGVDAVRRLQKIMQAEQKFQDMAGRPVSAGLLAGLSIGAFGPRGAQEIKSLIESSQKRLEQEAKINDIIDERVQRLEKEAGVLIEFTPKQLDQVEKAFTKVFDRISRIDRRASEAEIQAELERMAQAKVIIREGFAEAVKGLRDINKIAGESITEKMQNLGNEVGKIFTRDNILSAEEYAWIMQVLNKLFEDFRFEIGDTTKIVEQFREAQNNVFRNLRNFVDEHKELTEALEMVRQGEELTSIQVLNLVDKYEDLRSAIYVSNGELKIQVDALKRVKNQLHENLIEAQRAAEAEMTARIEHLKGIRKTIEAEIRTWEQLGKTKALVIGMEAKSWADFRRLESSGGVLTPLDEINALLSNLEKERDETRRMIDALASMDPLSWALPSRESTKQLEKYYMDSYKQRDAILEQEMELAMKFRERAQEIMYLPDGTIDQEAVRVFRENTDAIVNIIRERQQLAHEERKRLLAENEELLRQIQVMPDSEEKNKIMRQYEEQEIAQRALRTHWLDLQEVLESVTQAQDRSILSVDAYSQRIEDLTKRLEDLKFSFEFMSEDSEFYTQSLEEQTTILKEMLALTETEIQNTKRRIAGWQELLNAGDLYETQKEMIINLMDQEKDKLNDLEQKQREYIGGINEIYDITVEQRKKWVDDMNRLADEVIDVMKRAIRKQLEEELANLEELMKAEDERHRKRLENIDEEMNRFEEAIREQMRLIDEQQDREDFARQLAKEQQKRAQLQAQIDVLALDTSVEGQLRLAELRKQLAEQDERIAEMTRKRENDQRKKALQAELDAKRKEVEDTKKAENQKYEETKKRYEEERQLANRIAKEKLDDEMYWEQIRMNILRGNIENIKKELEGYWETFSKLAETNMKKVNRDINANLSLANSLAEALNRLASADYSKMPNIGDDIGGGNKFGQGGSQYGGSGGTTPTQPGQSAQSQKEQALQIYYQNKLMWMEELFKTGRMDTPTQKSLNAANDRLRQQYPEFANLGDIDDLMKKFPEFAEKMKAFRTYISNILALGSGKTGLPQEDLLLWIDSLRKKYGFGSFTAEFIRAQGLQYLNTGGYTGDWPGNEGRLAILHKKELVLGRDDTKNILAAVNVVRDLSPLIRALSSIRLSEPQPTRPVNQITINIPIEKFVGTEQNEDRLVGKIMTTLKKAGVV